MPLSQKEADRLLQMAKEFAEDDPIEFSKTQPMSFERALVSLDRRERFLLDVERGRRKRTRLRYQTRGREVIILARLELDGPDHINPPNSPYHPGERIRCPHIHVYVEGFEDRVAYRLSDVSGLAVTNPTDGLLTFEDFLRFCGVQEWPSIQLSV
jgi:uncharacterized protein DUF6978